jgi:prolyl oligopeptidase
MYKGSFVGDEFWAITDDTSGWCRLVAIPVATHADTSTWRELVPAVPGTKLSAVTPCGSRVALAVVRDGVMQLEVLDREGERVGQVALPGEGAFGKTGVGHLMSIMGDVVIADGDGCVFVHSTFDRAPGVYRADLLTLQVDVLVAPRHVQTDRLTEVRRTAGPRGVVYRVVRKQDTPLDGTAPVIVIGYGGFNVPWLPYYSAMAAAWTELGGVWVHTHLRGGGEGDKEFWHAGRMQRKQGTFDDLFEVIEELHARGEAVPERTGGWGSSNGGLLMGALVTQRPDLVRAAVLQVPILDLLQCRKDPGTIGIAMADYGNPDDPVDAPVLHAYSPYHQVKQGTPYPAVLLDAGATDPSCPAWHSRKTAARLQEATTSGNRVLLRVREGSGHNQMTSDKWFERDVEELVFLADELGLGPR